MTEYQFQSILRMTVEDHIDSILAGMPKAMSQIEVDSVVTFDAAGIMIHNKGLVVQLSDGSEFQVTIVRSGSGQEWASRR